MPDNGFKNRKPRTTLRTHDKGRQDSTKWLTPQRIRTALKLRGWR